MIPKTLIVTYFQAVGNMETSLFGKGFQAKLFPEIFICLGLAAFAASMIHRVCITTCILFSLPALYYMNRLSQKVHAAPAVVNVPGKRKK
ncbi:hypothetical protein RUM44_011607 [Polyplax serrata]|uniref:Dolichyl-diphosphooligosaccharide--protein glycosyltransferase subunit KCP2 n=1 Tax=Polyplax serrata TaxID=468196 RepID=A0ABR1AQJ0_POLSC